MRLPQKARKVTKKRLLKLRVAFPFLCPFVFFVANKLLLCGRGPWRFCKRPQLPAAVENLGQLGLQLDPARSRRNVKCLIHFCAVNECLNVSAVADHIQARPLTMRALDVLLTAEAFHILPIGIATIPVDPARRISRVNARWERSLERFLLAARFIDCLLGPITLGSDRRSECNRHRFPGLILTADDDKIADSAFDDL